MFLHHENERNAVYRAAISAAIQGLAAMSPQY